MTVSEWADAKRRLSPEASAEPGRWETSRAEYQRGMMDAIKTHEDVILMTSAQVGKSEILLNAVGYFIDQDPAPILMINPTVEMAQAWSKDRLAPMLRDTPALQGKVRDVRSRDSNNTISHKTFPGGHITMLGANSAQGLAGRPIRIFVADEVDRFPASAGTEGDPVRLGQKRTNNFWNRRKIMASTPTRKGYSRIEAEWETSDQRHYHVPCPHCGEEQKLRWKNVHWPSGEPWNAALHCESCGTEWTEIDRLHAVRHGRWIAEHPERRKAGFHLNELYSPWSTPAKMATDFVEAGRDPEKLKTFVNTSLSEPWEEDAERADAAGLTSRLENWGDDPADEKHERKVVPAEALVITCGVDVQDDRLEVERVAWGNNEESWSIDFQVIYGDPSTPQLWDELDKYLLTPSSRVGGGDPLHVAAAAIDSGGHFTQRVYNFCAPRLRRKVYAIKGASVPGRPVWPKRANKGKHGKAKSLVWIVGTDAAKDVIYARLKLDTRGPGYCHFPVGRDTVYFDQLTSNIVMTKRVKGFPVRVYELPSGKRDEALDCRVYAYAALQSLNIRWKRSTTTDTAPQAHREKATPSGPVEAPPPAEARPAAPNTPARHRRPQRSRGGWLRRN